MAAHQYRGTLPQALRQRRAQARVADQKITARSGEITDLEHRRIAAEKAAHVTDRPQSGAAHHAERNDGGRMAVHDGHHIRPRAINLAVDEPFQINGWAARLDRGSVGIKLKHVLCRDKRGRHASGEQKVIGPNGMA